MLELMGGRIPQDIAKLKLMYLPRNNDGASPQGSKLHYIFRDLHPDYLVFLSPSTMLVESEIKSIQYLIPILPAHTLLFDVHYHFQ